MEKAQRPRVQALAAQGRFRPLVAVDQVAEQRMTDVRHVHADLVRAAGLKLAADVRVAVVVSMTDQCVTARRAFFCVTAMRLRSVGWRPMGASTVPESSRRLPQTTASYVRAMVWSASCAERARCAKSFFAATSRPDVSLSMRCTMPGRRSPPTPESTVAAVGEQGVDERAVLVAGRGVHDHAARLVDDDEVVVLIHHVQRQVLRYQLEGAASGSVTTNVSPGAVL